uniref:C-type lectin domain-containing protein n=1 Tax=Mastacembelus armatus TaxID=205130 RepID=A0A3Q3MNZ8_9TELE
MSEDIYARPDLTKKVRFQKGEKEEDRNADVYDNNNATIYENSWKERSTLPKSQENTSKDQQQSIFLCLRMKHTNLRCPAGWKRISNSCYFIPLIFLKQNWNDSKKYCESVDAHLVIISNHEEQEFITSLVQTTNLYYWIGLTDQETESQWKWVNGTVATTTEAGEGEPIRRGGAVHGDVLQLLSGILL